MIRIGQTVLGVKGTKICVPIVGTTVKEILDATAVAGNTPCDVVELRIDYYERAHSIDAIIELLMLMKPQLKGRGLLFTWRTKGEGGEKSISSQDYFTMLERLIPTGLIDAIDIELFFDQDRMVKTIEFAKVHGVTIVMSNHDFNGTPSRDVIVNRLIQMKGFLADMPKIAVMPHTTGDVLTLLEATAEVKSLYPSDPIITMAMGPLGAITRASGALFGNAMTFASAGKPIVVASAIAVFTWSSGISVTRAICSATWSFVCPGVTVTVLSIRFVSSRSAAIAPDALISFFKV